MKMLRTCLLAAALAAAAVPALAQTTVQDGIELRDLSRFRLLAPKDQIESSSRQQYMALLNEAQTKGKLLPDSHPQVQRVRAIARRIIPFGARWNPDAAKWQWQVNVIDAPTVNAFCMPGGRIAFYSGILDTLRMSDDEVAAVMGHEIAHALREHSRVQQGKALATSVGTQLLGAIISYKAGVDPSLTSDAARAATSLAGLKYSRDDEREADLVGLDIAARAGFDPRAGVVLWQKMGQLSKSSPPAILSTHPMGPERIAKIEQHLPELLPVYAQARGTTADKLPPYRSR